MVWTCHLNQGTKISFDIELLDQIKQKLNDKVISTLQKTKDLYRAVDNLGASLLHYAAEFNNEIIVKHLINLGSKINLQNKDGNTPLLLATKRQHVTVVKILLESNAAIYICDNKGVSALKVAVHTNPVNDYVVKLFFEEVTTGCSSNNDEIAKKLVEINCPLYLAARHRQNARVIRIMISEGFNNEKDPISGKTALHFAVENLDSKSVQQLVYLGANVNAKDINGKTPIAMLINISFTEEVLSILETLKPRANLTSCDNDGFMQIYSILKNGSIGLVNEVLKYLDHNYAITDVNNRNIIHYLAMNRNVKHLSDNIENKNDVYIKKIHVNVRDNDGRTPLHYAMNSGNKTFAEFLINRGANMYVTDNDGFCPFLHAVNSAEKETLGYRVDCVKMLLKKKFYLDFMLKQYFTIHDKKSAIDEDFVLLEPVIAMLAPWQLPQEILQIFDLNPKLKKYFDFCTMELNNMEMEKVFGKMTLFDIIWDQNKKYEKLQLFLGIRSWQLRKRAKKYYSVPIYCEILKEYAKSICIKEIFTCISTYIAIIILSMFFCAKSFECVFFSATVVIIIITGILANLLADMSDENESSQTQKYEAKSSSNECVVLNIEDAQ